jgi:hypothetical protein
MKKPEFEYKQRPAACNGKPEEVRRKAGMLRGAAA